MRRLAIGAAPVVLGAILGLVAGLASGGGHRATVVLAVNVGGSLATPDARSGAGPIVPTVVAVAGGPTIVDNVASALSLDRSTVAHHLHVRQPPGTSLVDVSYDGSSLVEASRVAQEAGAIVQTVVGSRFGSGPRPVTVAIVEPAHETSIPRPLAQDTLLGALVGVLAAGALALFRRRGSLPAPPRRAAADRRDRDAEIRARVAAAAPPPPPEPASEPEPEPAPEPEPEIQPPRAGGHDLDDLERRSIAAGGPRLDERLAFIAALRPQARGGVIGREFDSIVFDVFEGLLDDRA